MKLCIIYNFAQHYRAGIFTLIDRVYDCDWFFGKFMDDVRKMDYGLLGGRVTELDGWEWHGIEYQKGILSLLRSGYDAFILLGQTKTLSTWRFALRARLFYPGKKVYFWTHGFYGKESGVECFVKRIFFKLPTGGIFTYGDHARQLMIEQGIHPDRIHTIHNSLDYDKQLLLRNSGLGSSIYPDHFGNDNPVVIFIGRLTPVKKLDMLVEAVALLKKQGRCCDLVFVGDGTERKHLEAVVAAEGLSAVTWFYGACYDEKINAELIYNADLCVAPGNVGLTAIHTMVFGTPVVSHDDFARQMPEFEAIKPMRTGQFFQQGNVSSLASVIDGWLLSNGNRRETIRRYCYEEIDSNWTPEFQISVIKEHIR